MKCPKCKGNGFIVEKRSIGEKICPFWKCDFCKGTGKVERTDGIDYNRKIAVPEHKAGQTGG